MQRAIRTAAFAAIIVCVLSIPALSQIASGASIASSQSDAPAFAPAVAEWQFLSAGTTPPAVGACAAAGRRCFAPGPMAHAYNYAGLHAAGNRGQGTTIAIVDSFGSSTIANDLKVFNNAFGLPHMCGEPGVTCTAGMPKFSILNVQGNPGTNPPPPNNGTGQENHNLWALEVSLDVEWAHATAPLANIVLVTTPTAETLGVQGLSQMMNAIEYVADHDMADVVSMSFGTGEGAFHNGLAALLNQRGGFMAAQSHKISLFASSGDGGSTNSMKEPVKNPNDIPYPSVIWPASDPLVTAVGGTYLCVDAATGTSVDTVNPPVRCQPARNPGSQRETGWIPSGGGYSILFPKPSFQNTLPPGSTFVGSSVGAPGPNSNMRGIPDIALQASATTGVLVYMTLPLFDRTSGTGCGGANPCDIGWYVVGGTSASAPQWAGIAAMADQIAGRRLGYITPALYQIANNPAKYAADFFDVTVNCNQTTSIPGYCTSRGWDAVTGLGTPNVAKLIPDLIAAIP
jgi:subtilase family serine protease